jgi:Domain of unknown function (DUF4383)
MEAGRTPPPPERTPPPPERDRVTAAHRAGVREGVARTLAQSFCLVLGLVLIAVGILGFIFGGSDFDTGAEVSGEEFLGLEVNGWHNVVHIATGAFLVLVAGTPASAAIGALVFGIVYAVVCVLGFINGDDLLDFIAINDADNWLHLALAVAAIIVGLTSGALGTSARRQKRRLGVQE